jgi:hypothetical protein
VEHVPFTLKVSEQGEVIIIVGADRIALGPKQGACEELCRFLAEVDFGECGR